MPLAQLRLFQELNDFVPERYRKRSFSVSFHPGDTVKNLIESHGVPHTEVDLITINSQSVPFSRRISEGDVICVYPVFETFDIAGLTRLRPEPLRETRFVLDVHLGKLARWLRTLGFDTRYEPPFDDAALVERAAAEARIILTRDRGLLMRKAVSHGYLVRSIQPGRQLKEVVRRFHLEECMRPFTLCLHCNTPVEQVAGDDVVIPEKIRLRYDEFSRCPSCGRVFWKGSHWRRMVRTLGDTLPGTPPSRSGQDD